MKKKIYVAYGSNMDLEQMRYRCPNAKMKGTGILENWRLIFKGSRTGSYATIEETEGQNVPVVYFTITKSDEENLDYYEGYPIFYYKREVQIKTDKGYIEGMVYIMDENRQYGLPSDRYYRVLSEAYEKFEFDKDILSEAVKYSANNMSKRN